ATVSPPAPADSAPKPSRRKESAPAEASPAAAAPPPPPRLSDVAAAAPPSAPESREAPPASDVTLTDITTMWPAVMEGLKSMSRVAWAVFSDSRPLSVSEGVLAVGVPEESKVKNARSSGHGERLRQVIIDVMHADLQVDVVLSGAIPSPATADVPSLDDDRAEEMTGETLALRELGATVIGEIEQG
ncbi:MAG: hypothetical protein ACKO70_02450, partial [Actinomycetota bacterium]